MEKRGKGRPRTPVPSILADEPQEVIDAFWRDYDSQRMRLKLRQRTAIVGPSTSAVGWLIARDSVREHLP